MTRPKRYDPPYPEGELVFECAFVYLPNVHYDKQPRLSRDVLIKTEEIERTAFLNDIYTLIVLKDKTRIQVVHPELYIHERLKQLEEFDDPVIIMTGQPTENYPYFEKPREHYLPKGYNPYHIYKQ